jgi:hypothetical protein
MFRVEFIFVSKTTAGRDPVKTSRRIENCQLKNKTRRQLLQLVECSLHNPKMEGLSPAITAGIGSEKIVKKVGLNSCG